MCLGIPMQVKEVRETYAICEGRNGRQNINTLLVGDVVPGQWLMTFLDSAREIIDAEQAALVNAALDGLQALAAGDETNMDHYFADLVGREPQLPDFLRKDKA